MQIEVGDLYAAAQALAFFAAGFETSSLTISHALYELALNPSIQGRVSKDIKDGLKSMNGVIAYESVNEMNCCTQFSRVGTYCFSIFTEATFIIISKIILTFQAVRQLCHIDIPTNFFINFWKYSLPPKNIFHLTSNPKREWRNNFTSERTPEETRETLNASQTWNVSYFPVIYKTKSGQCSLISLLSFSLQPSTLFLSVK